MGSMKASGKKDFAATQLTVFIFNKRRLIIRETRLIYSGQEAEFVKQVFLEQPFINPK